MESNVVGTDVPGDTAGSLPISATPAVVQSKADQLYDRLFTQVGQNGLPPAAAMCESWPDWDRVHNPEVRAMLVGLINEVLSA